VTFQRQWRLRAPWVLAVAAMGCGLAGAPSPIEPVAVVILPADRSTSFDVEPYMLPQVIEEPAETACTIVDEEIWRETALELRFTVDAMPFVSVWKQVTRLLATFALGDASKGVFVEVDVGKFATLRGWVRASELPLFARKQDVIGGFAVPLGGTRFQFRAASAGVLNAEYPLSPLIRTNKPLLFTKPCAFFTTSVQSLRALDFPDAVLRKGTVELRVSPNAEPVAAILDQNAKRRVHVLERGPKWTRIAFEDYSFAPTNEGQDGAVKEQRPTRVVGWVRSGSVESRSLTSQGFGGGGAHSLAVDWPIPNDWNETVCTEDVPLIARTRATGDQPPSPMLGATEERIVGRVRSGMWLLIGKPEGVLTPVLLYGVGERLPIDSASGKYLMHGASALDSTAKTFWIPTETAARACKP
jgi:hypothetical protein